jgi:mgtE-like transporter
MYFCLIFDFVAGAFLGANFENIMLNYPALLIVIPGLMGLRGNVFGSFGSRISTSLYLGSAEPKLSDRFILKNTVFSIWAATIPAIILLCVAFLKFREIDQILVVSQIVIDSSVLISSVLGIMTAVIVISSFKRGVDPDSIVGPAVATFADLVTIPSLILFIVLIEKFKNAEIIIVISVAILIFSIIYSVRGGDLKTYREVVAIVSLLALVQSVTGNILEEFSDMIHLAAILSFAYPAIIGSIGNYGSIVVARTSTKLHMGEISKSIGGDVLRDLLYIFATSLFVFPLIITVSLTLSNAFGGGFKFSIMPFLAFFVIYSIIIFAVLVLSLYLSLYLYEKGIDPDNGGIPIITTISDVIGTVATVLIAGIFIIL